MARPPALPAGRKLEIILEHLKGGLTISEAARVAGVSEQSIGNWKRQFISGGRRALESTACNEGIQQPQTDREMQLHKEVRDLKAALGEVYLQLRAIKQATGREVRTRPWPITGSVQGRH